MDYSPLHPKYEAYSLWGEARRHKCNVYVIMLPKKMHLHIMMQIQKDKDAYFLILVSSWLETDPDDFNLHWDTIIHREIWGK